MAAYEVELVSSPLSVLGEGPHWDVDSQNLYYVDIYGKTESILRFNYAEQKIYGATIDDEPIVGFIIPVEGTSDEFAVGLRRRVGIIRWDGKSPKATLIRIAFEVEQSSEFETNRFNDAKSDPTGRFYGGTMRIEEYGDIFYSSDGSFYKYKEGEEVVKLRSKIGISNGLAWNTNTNKFYYIDSCQLDVKEFDYDSSTGNIFNERVVVSFKVNDDRPTLAPDGMTIDTDGILYVALWGGSSVAQVNPITGEIIQKIKIPASQVTSVAFGGPNLDILFVTTASTDFEEPQPSPAGSLFKVTGLGVKGLPAIKVRL